MATKVESSLESTGFKRICSTENEVLDFIHDIKHKDHCILIFHDEQKRDKIVNEFINPKFAKNSVTACFSNNPTKYQCNHQMSYDDLVQDQKFQPHVVGDFLLMVLANSYEKNQTRIACEETSWLAEHGYFEDHQKWGNTIDERVINESSVMCCYDASKLNDEQMKIVLSSRKYIILDEPFSVFGKKDF